MNDSLFFAQNPWRTGPWQPDPLWIDRATAGNLLRAVQTGPIQLLTGARRTGKTTLIRQIIANLITASRLPPSSIFYLNLDDIDLRSEIKANPHLLSDVVSLYTGKPLERHTAPLYFFLDEVQKAPDFFDQIKLYHDTFTDRLRFLLSGSGTLELHSRSAETFAGRIERTRLYPFSLKEILRHSLLHPFFPSLVSDLLQNRFEPSRWQEWQATLIPHAPECQRLLESILIWGCLPEVILDENDHQRRRYLTNYRVTYLERDIRSLTQVGSLEGFARVLDIVLLQIANLIDKTKIAREVGISQNTVRKYLSILEQTFVLEQIRPYVGSLRRRMVKTPKVFFFDNGFSTVISQIDTLTLLKTSGRLGALYENLCLNEIIKTVADAVYPPDVCFWRTVGGTEVDFVLKQGDVLLPIEVKYTAEANLRVTKGLRRFKQAYAGQVDRMLVIYTGPLKIEGDIIFLPPWMI